MQNPNKKKVHFFSVVGISKKVFYQQEDGVIFDSYKVLGQHQNSVEF